MTGFEAVLLYIVWIVVQVLTYAGPRIPAALFTGKPMDSWERTKAPTDSAFFMRAKGAHLNSMENFPLFAADYSVAIIARSKRDYVWLFSRKPNMSAADLARYTALIGSWGYDTSKLLSVPQRWPEP